METEKNSDGNYYNSQVIEFLSFSKKISENEISKFLENKGIYYNNIKFLDFNDDYSI
jgi:hypothetical protein